MKITKLSLLAAAALGSMMVAPRSEAQTLTVSQGSLMLGFYTYDSQTNSVGSNTYVFNLGSAAAFRENTLSFSDSLGNLGNIGADLTSAFGENWQENSQLRWGIFGASSTLPTVQNGDTTRTVYFSTALSSFDPGSTTAPTTSSSSAHTLISNAVNDLYTSSNGKTAGTNPNGAIIQTTIANDITDKVPPTALTYFNGIENPFGSFGAGSIGSSTSDGGYDVEAALDMYRILNNLTNADLTSGLGETAGLRSGQYIGTLTIDSDGNLRMDAVPEPSTYALMAIAGIALLIFRRRRTAADVQ